MELASGSLREYELFVSLAELQEKSIVRTPRRIRERAIILIRLSLKG